MDRNEEDLRGNLDVLSERREISVVQVEAHKRLLARRYNTRVRPRQYMSGDLVWRRTTEGQKEQTHGKLAANWEGPFSVKESLNNGAYRLESMDGRAIPNTWNIANLKFYFS